MELNEYQEQSKRTLDKHKSDRDMLIECIVGLAEELGEALSPIKKYLFHNHELDRDKVIKELGDMMFYHSGICTLLDITLEEVAKANIEKLEKRYPQGFTQERSINRECEHEWQYTVEHNSNKYKTKFNKVCRKCGKKGGIDMFKVGDKVRCIKTMHYNWIHKNEIFEVVKVLEEGLILKNMTFKTFGGTTYPFECFELVKEKKKAEVWTKKDIEKNAKTQTFNIYPQKVIFNDKATILFYKCSFDYIPIERKIVAKCQEGDKFTKEDGLRICVLKAMKRELERELKQY